MRKDSTKLKAKRSKLSQKKAALIVERDLADKATKQQLQARIKKLNTKLEHYKTRQTQIKELIKSFDQVIAKIQVEPYYKTPKQKRQLRSLFDRYLVHGRFPRYWERDD